MPPGDAREREKDLKVKYLMEMDVKDIRSLCGLPDPADAVSTGRGGDPVLQLCLCSLVCEG